MKRNIYRSAWIAMQSVLVGMVIGAQGKLPETGPDIANLFPAGGQKGSTIEIVIRGRNLDEVSVIEFQHPGIEAEICHAEYNHVVAIVKIAKNVPPGIHDYRLIGRDGASVGAIVVSDLPDRKETEPNNDAAAADKVSLPAVINGVIENNDTDHFAFSAEAGDTLVFRLMASRLGSGLDATLTVSDAKGNEIAFNDDTGVSGDPRLVFRAPAKGDYTLQVANTFGPFGGPFAYYRLTMGKLPAANAVMPMGVELGKLSDLEISGFNLDLLDRVQLGGTAGEIVEKGFARAKLRFQIPGGQAPGPSELLLFAGGRSVEAEIKVAVTQTPETKSAAARSRTAPQRIFIPAGVSGLIGKNRATDFYDFDVKAGDQLTIEVQAEALGSTMDPAILLYDSAGKLLAFQDELLPWYFTEPPNHDPRLVQRFERAGRYLLAVRDSSHNGGPDYFYHLSLRKAEPDFQLAAKKPAVTLFRGRKNTVPVRVRRMGGWDTPVELWAEAGSLPRSASEAQPKNSTVMDCNAKAWEVDGTDVEIPIDVPADAAPGYLPIRVYARGKDREGRVVEHTLETLYYPGFAGPGMGRVQYRDYYGTVTDLPGLILEPPNNFALAAGKSERLKINVSRYDDAKGPLPVVLEGLTPGITVEGAELPAGASVIELKLTAAKDMRAATLLVRAGVGKYWTPRFECKINAVPEKKK